MKRLVVGLSLLAAARAGADRAAFEKASEAVARERAMPVASRWEDDLDGDGKPERIARMCNDEAGLYVIEKDKRKELYQLPFSVDGRTGNCPPEGKAAWDKGEGGAIAHQQGFHRGSTTDRVGLRDGDLVLLLTETEVHDEDYSDLDSEDYENLTVSHGRVMDEGTKGAYALEGTLLLVRPAGARPTHVERVIAGQKAWSGPGDASFTIAASPDPAGGGVLLRLAITDDKPGADKVEIWWCLPGTEGSCLRAVTIAAGKDGKLAAKWRLHADKTDVLPAVSGTLKALEVHLPFAAPTETGEVREGFSAVFVDDDGPGGETVLATSTLDRKGKTYLSLGLLEWLPGAARWPHPALGGE